MDLTGELRIVLAGRYEIERELGHGGMAIVYLARDLKHRRLVALKVLRPELANTLGTERFLREIAIAAPLVHPNILALYDSGEASRFVYYVMPYVDGPTLRQRLDREVQLPIDEAIAIAREVASALDYAHAHGVVHRDIKPDNILLLEGHVLVADFGLARAVSSAASTPLTRNMVIGTPAYMSPEQCSTERTVDARSDIYSLACVVFEMITGVPPFRGATAQAIIAHHLSDPPPSVCAERSSCPPALDEAVRRALAKVPADRFHTAGELVRAMEAGGGEPLPPPLPPRQGRRIRRWSMLAALIIAALTLPAWFATRATTAESDGAIATDTTRVVLLPLEGASPTGTLENELLYEAFARWNGIILVDPFQVTDAVRRRGKVASEDDARAVARSLGAGRYVRGRITRLGDSVSVRAGLYDVDRDAPLQIASVRTGLDGTRGPRALDRLADSLLLRGMPADTPTVDAGRHSLAAVQAFASAQRALDDFDLPKADSAFESARAVDPTFARATLWLAQVRAWRELPINSWRAMVEPSEHAGAELAARDRELARALLALADGDFVLACRTYERMKERNPRDFAAWYGLGQCRTRDRLVVRDASSPSGWRFRSSHGAGLRAYEHALELLPSAHRGFQSEAFATLRELLLTDRDRLISGYSGGADSARFLGRLSWVGDSIALVPYPWSQIAGGAPIYPPGFDRAVVHQREVFRQIASTWAVALPGASAAKEALSLSLEMLGDASAADTLRAARRLATDSTRRLQLAAAEVLVRLKFAIPDDAAALRAARALADSLLVMDVTTNPAAARLIARVAEAAGKCERAETLARAAAMPRTQPLTIPRHYDADAAYLVTRASLGCQRSTSAVTILDVDRRLRSDPLFSASARHTAEDVLLVAAAQLSFPSERRAIAALGPDREGRLIEAMNVAATDAIGARRRLARIDAGYGPIGPPIDAALPEARLWLELRDTVQALALLRRAIDAVPSYEPRVLTEQGRVGALVRGMALRAELERLRGDPSRARAWAAAVVQLWSGADDELQPLVRRMQSLARS
jgi:tetratricopeptide (TPR) repeat protein